MEKQDLYTLSLCHMQKLCEDIAERCVGSEGNRQATEYFEKVLKSLGWKTSRQNFDAIDWHEKGASLVAEDQKFKVLVSPYSLGFSGSAPMAAASRLSELKNGDFRDKILLLHGEIAKEQLMPKNFVFYNPEEHQQIVSLLEKSKPKAIISATGRSGATAGGVYPFPLIEDGDFDIPSVYMTDEEGKKLLEFTGQYVTLDLVSERIPSGGYNVTGLMGNEHAGKIVVTAHIDAKKGTPGAIDNATGVSILLILAELLRDHQAEKAVEIVALNGEDYYAVPGQMKYIGQNKDSFDKILLNINIDGAAYKDGVTSFSLFGLPDDLQQKATHIMNLHSGITSGILWPQGDHSIFVQQGVPAIAVSSQWFIENIDTQDITHTPKDNLEIVDYNKIVEIARALNDLIRKI